MLKSITEIIQEKAIEYKPSDYYLHYKDKDNLTSKTFTKIYKTFFNKVIQELYKGWDFHCPLGVFYIERVHVDPGKNRIDFGATRKARKEPGNETVTIYRTNDYFFAFNWVAAKIYPQLKSYDFKFSWQFERMLGTLTEDLKLYIKDTRVI